MRTWIRSWKSCTMRKVKQIPSKSIRETFFLWIFESLNCILPWKEQLQCQFCFLLLSVVRQRAESSPRIPGILHQSLCTIAHQKWHSIELYFAKQFSTSWTSEGNRGRRGRGFKFGTRFNIHWAFLHIVHVRNTCDSRLSKYLSSGIGCSQAISMCLQQSGSRYERVRIHFIEQWRGSRDEWLRISSVTTNRDFEKAETTQEEVKGQL